MSLQIPAGHHLLRLTALTPLNCGDAAGSAAVDRPVALDTWGGLPYLPSSALKGVLAGRSGNVFQGGALNTGRTDLFGAPDDDETGGGKPSLLVFGDGDLLSFPILLRNARRAQVAVASTIYRLAGLGLIEAPGLLRVEPEDAYSAPPELAEALPSIAARLRPARFGCSGPPLAVLAGAAQDQPVVLAAPQAAVALWQMSAEQRTLTALGSDSRVRSGSLRAVELIPAGAVFVSLVSNLSQATANLGACAPLQLGAWESIGFGYLRAEMVPGKGLACPAGEEPPPGPVSGARPSPPEEVMLRVFEAIDELRAQPEASRVRSAILDLGPRLRQRGMSATLAFCLAKAGGISAPGMPGAAPRKGREQRAYRWVLHQLFAVAVTQPFAELHRRTVATIAGEETLPVDFELTRLWLRRYAETMLPREPSDV